MAYKIPLFNLNFDEREAQAAYDTIKSGWISTGPKNAELEQMFIDMWKVKYAVSMSNCTDALHVCIRYIVHAICMEDASLEHNVRSREICSAVVVYEPLYPKDVPILIKGCPVCGPRRVPLYGKERILLSGENELDRLADLCLCNKKRSA